MKQVRCLWHVILVLLLSPCSESLDAMIVVIKRNRHDYSTRYADGLSKYGLNQSTPLSFTPSYPVKYLEGQEIFDFWKNEYKTNKKWLAVIVSDKVFCPIGLLQAYSLSYVTLGTDTCHGLSNQLIDMSIKARTVAFAYKTFLLDLEKYTNASTDSVAVMFDKSGLDHKYQRHLESASLLFQIDIPVITCNVSNELKNLTAKTEVKVVFVFATSQCEEIMLQEAHRLDMLRGRYRWIMYATDGRVPECNVCQQSNVIILRDRNPTHNVVTMNYEEKSVRFVDAALKYMDKSLTSDPTLTCEFNCTDQCEADCRQLFKNAINETGDGGFGVYLTTDGITTLPVDVDIYRYDNHCNKIGTWKPDTGMSANEQLFFNNDSMVVLRIAVVVEPPFVFRNQSGTDVTYYGYSIDVMNDIAERIGFTFTVRECDDGVYGNLDSNQLWNGCVGNILKGDADIIVGAMTVTADRETVVDYTLPYYDFAGIQIMMKKQTQQVNTFYFADVFTSQAWLCLGGVIALTSVLLMLFDKYSPAPGFSKNPDYQDQPTFNLHESIWFVIGSLTMSGGGEPPKSFSARLLVAGFWFFSVIMMSTFTANLAAFLTVSRLGVSISSLDALSAQSEVKYSAVAHSSVMNYFERMAAIEENFYTLWKNMSLGQNNEGGGNNSFAVWDYPLGDKYVTIWRAIQSTGFVSDTQAGIDKVSSENFALISESPIIKYLTSRDCDLTSIGDQFSIRPYAFALKENSVYTKKISAAILDLQQDRRLETYKRKWWDDGKVSCPEDTSDQGLDLQSLTGSFLVVVMGVCSGVLVLVVELLWTRARAHKRTNIMEVKPVQTPVVSFNEKKKPDTIKPDIIKPNKI